MGAIANRLSTPEKDLTKTGYGGIEIIHYQTALQLNVNELTY